MADNPLAAEGIPRELVDEIDEHKTFFRVGGVVSVIVGALAILMPTVATLAAELLFGILLTVNGIVGLVTAFWARRASRVASGFFLSLLALVAGLVLLVYPQSGVFALTIIIIGFLAASGVLKLWFATRLERAAGRGWMIAGGVLSLVLAVLIAVGLPGSALWVIGVFLGVDLIFYGVTLLAVSRIPARFGGM
jgi:uncharacterized membrane protein HdeD (DUF308 family)